MKTVEIRSVRIGEGMPKICVPVMGAKKEEILQGAAGMKEVPADIVEWRADWYEDVFDIACVKDVLKLIRRTVGDMPLLFTFRTLREGGEKAISAERYAVLNREAAASGFVDLIDVEAFTGDEAVKKMIDEAHRNGVKVIVSNHDFQRTPQKEEMIERLCKMQKLGADICKIAVMPRSRRDVITLLSATEEMVREHADRPVISMSMAEEGVASRLCGELFGSAVTFGQAGQASAPGQVEAGKLHTVLEILHEGMKKS